MASCAQVEHVLQAYVDGELSQAERVIVEQHVAVCRACERSLQEYQRTSAMVFETLAPCRLGRDLRQAVLEHLPEIDRMPVDVKTVNWRVKHPATVWARISRGVPVAVGVVLLLVALVLRYEWPQTAPSDNVIGMVMDIGGNSQRYPATRAAATSARQTGFVEAGDSFQTGQGSHMMLTLAGPTEIKLDENTLVKVNDDRWINVIKGRVWLQVNKDDRLFRVVPPIGEITVLGTEFDVDVQPDKTRVTVVEGQVHVDNEGAVGLLTRGQQVDLIPGARSLVPWSVDAKYETRWASSIGPSAEAQFAFDEHIAPRTQAKLLRAEQVFMLPRNGGSTAIKSIEVQWNPDAYSRGHCDYLVYVTNSKGNLLFRDVIPGSVFSDKSVSSYKLQVPEGAIDEFRVLYIRVIPDLASGVIETSFKDTIIAETR